MLTCVKVCCLLLVLFINLVASSTWDAGKVSTHDGKKIITVAVEPSRADTVRASMGYAFKDFSVFMNKVFCVTKCNDRLTNPKQKVQVKWDGGQNNCICTVDETPDAP